MGKWRLKFRVCNVRYLLARSGSVGVVARIIGRMFASKVRMERSVGGVLQLVRVLAAQA